MTSKRKIFTLIILFGMSSTTLPVASRSISLAKKLIQFVLRTPIIYQFSGIVIQFQMI